MAMSEENVAIVRRAYDTFMREGSDTRREDLTDDALKEFFDPEVELVPIPQGVLAGGEYVGFEGLRRFWADFFAAWDEMYVEPQEFRETGDLVVATLRMEGRMHDLEIDEVWSNLLTLRNGRVVRIQGFGSRNGALEAAGLRE